MFYTKKNPNIARLTPIVPLILLLILHSSILSYGESWRGIVPLKTHRLEIENRFGECLDKDWFGCTYEIDKIRVRFTYSTGKCEIEQGYRWNVKTGTVLSIETTENTRLSLDLREVKGLEPVDHEELVGVTQYEDAVNGLFLVVDRDVIISRMYGPKLSDRHDYKCVGRVSN